MQNKSFIEQLQESFTTRFEFTKGLLTKKTDNPTVFVNAFIQNKFDVYLAGAMDAMELIENTYKAQQDESGNDSSASQA